MRGPALLRAIAVATLLVTGCVTTRVTTNERDARVYVDGRRVAPGQRFFAFGPPHEAEVRVVARDGREVRGRMKRSFGYATFALGAYTMGACWLLCWSYPSELTLLLPPRPVTWDAPTDADPWARPPQGWLPPDEPAPRPTSTDAPPEDDPWRAPPSR